MLRPSIVLLLGLVLAGALAGCGGPSCRSPDDCPFGSYCVLDVDGAQVSGTCVEDCFEHTDCPTPAALGSRAICNNQGRCEVVPRIPQVRLRLPEPQTRFPEGTRSVLVSGEVETAAEQVSVRVAPVGTGGCPGGPPTALRLVNDGTRFEVLPFSVDQIPVEPGTGLIRVEVSVGGVDRSRDVRIEVGCPGCAEVSLDAPQANAPTTGLVLPALRGRVSPPVPLALWRVRGGLGGVFDGRLPVGPDGGFALERLPLFAGVNQVEVVVTGVGTGTGTTRCSSWVQAPGRDRGLRVIMTWDSAGTDLDLHLVGPGGRFGDPSSDLSARTPRPAFGGEVEDDFDGFGPERLAVDVLPDGVYGLVVEPVLGAGTATLRLVDDGTPVTVGPVGPVFVDGDRGELWVAGTLTAVGGDVSFRPIDARLPIDAPPTAPPSAWPDFR